MSLLSGSCSKENNAAQVQCTEPKLHPVYGQFLSLLFFSLKPSHRTNRFIRLAIFYAQALHSICCSQHTSLHRHLPWFYFRLFRLVYPDGLPLQDRKVRPLVV